MRKSNFALRLQPSLLEEARKLAEAEGVALNQLINVAVAEKLSALDEDALFEQLGIRVKDEKNPGGVERQQQFDAAFTQDAADMLSMKEQPDGYAWLASHTPVTRVGKSASPHGD